MGAGSSREDEEAPRLGHGALGFTLNGLADQTHFSREELGQMHNSFMQEGKEGSTVITREQFVKVLSSQQIVAENKGYLNALFDAFDKNGDGVVNFVEFCSGVSIVLRGSPEEKYQVRPPTQVPATRCLTRVHCGQHSFALSCTT